MKSIIFICPYFGKLPDHFSLWLKSCELNSNINWLILTDDSRKYSYPDNVKVIYMTFKVFENYVRKKMRFPVTLSTPYKLCDYKPIYGYIFNDYIQKYDFWGHCDISDCIFGNIRKFITDPVLDEYDKIFYLGHMTLYKNNNEVNTRFNKITKSGITIKSILQDKNNRAFDELNSYSINTIYKEYNFTQYRNDELYADISPMRFSFQLSKYNENYEQYYESKIPRLFYWNQGTLLGYYIKNNKVECQEYAYIHFQKRKMSTCVQNKFERFLIVPNKFIDYPPLKSQKELLYEYSREKLLYKPFWQLKFRAMIWHIKNIKKK